MLSGKEINYSYDNRDVLEGIDISIDDGEKVGLVGPNGIGKSTLLKIIAGEQEPQGGEILKPKGYEVGYMPQDLEDWVDRQVFDFLTDISGVGEAQKAYEQAAEQMESSDPKALAIFQEAYEKVEKYDVYNFETRAQKALAKVGLDSVSKHKQIEELSGGQRTRLSLAAVLVSKYDLFLLDEPTNNLDLPGIVILEKFIKGSKASFLLVSHDRRFLRQTTDRIIELTGPSDVKSYGLGYDEYIAEKHRQEHAERQRYEEYTEEKKRLQESAKESMYRSGSASGARNRSDSEKIGFNASKERAVKSHSKSGKRIEKRLEQMEEPPIPPEKIFLDFDFSTEEIINKTGLSVKDVIVEYKSTETAPEFRLGPISLDLKLGERVAITGNNGVGKTTLLRSIISPDIVASGTVNVAKFAKIGFMDQHHSLPLGNKNALENFKALTTADETEARRMFKQFNIEDNVAFTTANNISPGERSKVLLASIAFNRSNILLLDEPTNHLDIPSIEGLERALSNYKGSILLVTHDRDFLESLKVSRTIEIK